MAVYKVIQNIEAEDKIVGPLTFKGFIYVAIAGVLAFIEVRLLISSAPSFIKILFLVIFLPPMLLFGVLASPLGREQPTEVWLLSRIRFFLKPHKRIWDQAGTKQPVTITAPKRPMEALTKNISQTEVASRLQTLARSLDGRGIGPQNPAINLSVVPRAEIAPTDDRLAGAAIAAATEPDVNIRPADDILDEQNNAAAQEMVSKLVRSEETRRLALLNRLDEDQMESQRQARAQPNTGQIGKLTPAEQALLDNLHDQEPRPTEHSRVIYAGATNTPVTHRSQAVKLELSQSGNDLSVAAISKLANRRPDNPGEVSVQL